MTTPEKTNRGIRAIYDTLLAAYGPQRWWPAETPTEVVIGAILTQNTAWTNVERAVANLRGADCLTWPALRAISAEDLGELIRPSGYFRVKSKRLKAFTDVICRDFGGSLDRLLDGGIDAARERLLAIHGIGPETADSILLYAGGRPSFVIDTYTHRMVRRHFLIDGEADYEGLRAMFQAVVDPDTGVYNEYHALIVRVGKEHCRVRARCDGCPIAHLPHDETL